MSDQEVFTAGKETIYEITVVETSPDKPSTKTTFTGGRKGAAGVLRGLANEIDPPRPAMRNTFVFNKGSRDSVEQDVRDLVRKQFTHPNVVSGTTTDGKES